MTDILPHRNGNGAWKSIALFLAGVVVSMVAFYVVEFHRTITRDEAVQLIEQVRPGPPWVQDRTNVLQRLDEDRGRIVELEQRPSRIPTSAVEPWVRNRLDRLDDHVTAIDRRLLGLKQ